MIDSIKEFLQVYINNPVISFIHIFNCFQHRLLRTLPRPKAITAFMKLPFVYWRQYLCCCLLNHPVSHRWDSQLSFTSIFLGYFYPFYWHWFVCLVPYVFPEPCTVRSQMREQIFALHSINSCRTIIVYYLLIGSV